MITFCGSSSSKEVKAIIDVCLTDDELFYSSKNWTIVIVMVMVTM